MKRNILAIFVVAAALACGEPTTSTPVAGAPGYLRLRGGVAFDVSGTPAFADKAVVPATFAVALIDSVSGPVILAFNEKSPGTGDFFILSLAAVRTGVFGPCADGPSKTYPDGSILTLAGACQVRLLQDVVPAGMLLRSRTFLQSVGGSVTVQSVGDRLVGTVADLQLSGGSGTTDVTIASGEFDLPIMRGAAAAAMESCFLASAIGNTCKP
jgi:hypothetical protein